jgi:hypothetical protein
MPPGGLGEFGVPEIGGPSFAWGIGSNTILNLLAWHQKTPWRNIEDATFGADVRSAVQRTVPFVTMLHEPSTRVAIAPLAGVDARAFKLCRTTPFAYDVIGLDDQPGGYTSASFAVPWPAGASPYYTVSLPPQVLVPNAAYQRQRVDAVVELCERYCDHPFRSNGGEDYPSWERGFGPTPMEECQWTP